MAGAVDEALAGFLVLVLDVILATVDRRAERHQRRDEEMRLARGALRRLVERLVVHRAPPSAILTSRGVATRSAADVSDPLRVAQVEKVAAFALPARGVFRELRRRLARVDDAPRAGLHRLECVLVEMHPLGVNLVVVFVHRKVQRALDAEQPHVGLHLRVVRGLALADAVFLQVGEALRAVRLYLEDRPGFRRLGEAATDTVDRSAEVAALITALDLLAVLVGVQLDANAAQLLGDDRLLALAAVE